MFETDGSETKFNRGCVKGGSFAAAVQDGLRPMLRGALVARNQRLPREITLALIPSVPFMGLSARGLPCTLGGGNP